MYPLWIGARGALHEAAAHSGRFEVRMVTLRVCKVVKTATTHAMMVLAHFAEATGHTVAAILEATVYPIAHLVVDPREEATVVGIHFWRRKLHVLTM